jgi:beta-galactosidase/beta-glucuronidase
VHFDTDEMIREYTEWMRDNWNHPSVVIWDANNETWGEKALVLFSCRTRRVGWRTRSEPGRRRRGNCRKPVRSFRAVSRSLCRDVYCAGADRKI